MYFITVMWNESEYEYRITTAGAPLRHSKLRELGVHRVPNTCTYIQMNMKLDEPLSLSHLCIHKVNIHLTTL